MELHLVIFSKDRPLQLDATLRSFQSSCEDAAGHARVSVLYLASDPRQERLYRRLAEEHPGVALIPERGFKPTLLSILDGAPAIGFAVDDAIFVRPFRVAPALSLLAQHPEVLGVSLRLGRNTTYCYSHDKPQRVPATVPAGEGLLAFEWPKAELDFGYPLELSSSVYRREDAALLLQALTYRNPNELEAAMDAVKGRFAPARPVLVCPEQSIAFCAPVNVVQQVCPNRAGKRPEYSAEALTAAYEAGRRVRTEVLRGFLPRACHEEVELALTDPIEPAAAPAPAPAHEPEPEPGAGGRAAWLAQGCPAPVPEALRAEAAGELAGLCKVRVLLDLSGGDAFFGAAPPPDLEAAVSVHRDPARHAEACLRHAGDPRVVCLRGEADALLPALLDRLDLPALVCLRAGPETGKAALLAQLRTVFRHRVSGHAVLLDGARYLGATADHPSLRELSELVAAEWPGHAVDLALDGVRITPA